jgi:polysaccharide biosynthesis/export protein
MSGLSKATLLWLMAVMALTAMGQQRNLTSQPNSKRPDGTQVLQAATVDPNYIIGPNDELNVNVWKEPDVSRTVPVRPDGKISLPLLNDIQAAGQTPMQLAADVADKLTKFVQAPQVTVIVTAVNSQRVYVLGEVGRAGAYPMLPNMTVLQAISSAGGFSQYAKEKGVYVLRTENDRPVRFPFNYKEVINGRKSEENILLKPGDTIVVP